MLTILTAGTGLGVYIPGLLMHRALALRGVDVALAVLESLYTEAALRERERAVPAFQSDFRLAQLAHRRARHDPARFDAARVAAWQATLRGQRIAAWSGFWLPLLAQKPVVIDHCRIDAVVSASFENGAPRDGDREIWLWHEGALHWRLPVDARLPLPWAERERRVVAHGGGWALGEFGVGIDALPTGWEADVLCGQREMAVPRARVWRVASEWRPWNGAPRFPPMAPAGSDDFSPAHEHRAYELLRGARAVISKPGGGTLIESLWAATPLLMLPPFGAAEARSGALWQSLGLGMPLADWLARGARGDDLKAMHERLLAARVGPSYIDALAQEFACA